MGFKRLENFSPIEKFITKKKEHGKFWIYMEKLQPRYNQSAHIYIQWLIVAMVAVILVVMILACHLSLS